ncbi:putative divalent cation/proton antiporter TMEM165 isoform X3 [Parasteatoda tepidariorum]|uniref:putative divalent cation/proton antiporter TMEM165 isoform X3 n=1 Tax=Parasteatoda tepidariorum TaxID=114398 RepID=UPI001C718FCE|nr:transmembrane protein 165-like isoform X2 [Parasteatoda tepidariorum]
MEFTDIESMNESFSTLSTFENESTNGTNWLSTSTEDIGKGFVSAFLMTAVSEIGDKTFFIAVVLSLSHLAKFVFAGAISALILMTALSGCKMNSSSGKEELEEVQRTVDIKMSSKVKEKDVEAGIRKSSTRWVFVEAFIMTFLAEWGDRSQIATVVLAAKESVIGVLFGAIVAHAACTLAAVIGGKVISDRISLRAVTIFGGLLFFAFAINSFVEVFADISLASS